MRRLLYSIVAIVGAVAAISLGAEERIDHDVFWKIRQEWFKVKKKLGFAKHKY